VKIRSFSTRPYRRRKLLILTSAAALLVGVAVLLGGCVISNVQLNSNVPAGSNHQISMTITSTVDSTGPTRGVIAIRIPTPWDVKSVTFTGALNGSATESAVMEGIYATEWEATVGAGHNGHKDGYKWWVGYSGAEMWAVGDASQVTFLIDTHGRGGTYMLDFATGIAAQADPEALADKGFWQVGSAGDTPTGVLLDQVITLHCFTDVTPGTAYYEAIQGMGVAGVIAGKNILPGGYFEYKPSDAVFRAQYSKMIDGALGLAVAEDMAQPQGTNWSDMGSDILPGPGVFDSLYPHEYVWVAFNNNIVLGYEKGPLRWFAPYEAIKRGHVVTMTVRALQNLHPDALDPVPAEFVQTWGNNLMEPHKTNARIAEYNGLLAGLPLTTTAANGTAPMPRGEVAQVLWNMMNLIAP